MSHFSNISENSFNDSLKISDIVMPDGLYTIYINVENITELIIDDSIFYNLQKGINRYECLKIKSVSVSFKPLKFFIIERKLDLEKNELIGHFNPEYGLSPVRNEVLKLLKNVLIFLNDSKIDHFLISGTLLGYVRHNDFIPWDDDIDILVSSKFLSRNSNIQNGFKILKTVYNGLYKAYDENKWPFIDLFVYTEDKNNLYFFGKKWDKSKFYPSLNVTFNNLYVTFLNVASDPCSISYFIFSIFRIGNGSTETLPI